MEPQGTEENRERKNLTCEIPLYLIGGTVVDDLAAWFDTALGAGRGHLVLAVAGLGLVLALARFLHSRQIFPRLSCA